MDQTAAPQPVLRFPSLLEGRSGVTVRPWRVADAVLLNDLIFDNLDHLRPWMPWVIAEPMAIEDREDLMAKWEVDLLDGTKDVVYGIFLDGEPVGSTGFHRRVGPRGLEVGYWVDHRRLGRGIATESTRALTAAAFRFPEIDAVEIHHDVTNEASGRVPAKLGFEDHGTRPGSSAAPAETGTERVWRITKSSWEALDLT